MKPIYKGMTGKEFAAESGFHAEVISDGQSAVLSLFNVATKTWSMAIIDDASNLAGDAACEAYAIRAAKSPREQGTVTEDDNEEYFDRCLELEDQFKETANPKGVDVDDEEDDADNDYL